MVCDKRINLKKNDIGLFSFLRKLNKYCNINFIFNYFINTEQQRTKSGIYIKIKSLFIILNSVIINVPNVSISLHS